MTASDRHDTPEGGTDSSTGEPPQWWHASQLSELCDAYPDWPVHDAASAPQWRELREAMKCLTGSYPDTAASYEELVVVPAGVAAQIAGKSLTFDDIAEYSREHGLDDPRAVAQRLADGAALDAEQTRAKIRALFEAEPLPLGVTGAPSFPVHALPAVLADMVQAVADDLGIDPAMCAPMALGAVSAALCGRVNVQVDDGSWIETGVSHTVVVGDSGDKKSPALSRLLTDPLVAAEKELIAQHYESPVVDIATIVDSEGESPSEEMSFDVVLPSVKPDGPPPKLFASDITPESLVDEMAAQGGRMTVTDAEGHAFDVILGRYSATPALGIFLSAYTGEAFRVDRKTSGSVRMDNPSLTVCIATQPHVAQEVLTNSRFIDKGLVARIQFAFPESRESRYQRGIRKGQHVPAQVSAVYNSRLRELAVELFPSELRTARFSEAAQRRMRGIDDQFDARRLLEDGDLRGSHGLKVWAAKSSGRVARRALHLHMAEHGPAGAGLLIEPHTVDRALDIEEWFIVNVRAALGLTATAPDSRTAAVRADDAQAVVTWLARQRDRAPTDPIPVADLTAKGPKRTRPKDKRDAVLDLLENNHYVVRTRIGKADALYLHPAAGGQSGTSQTGAK